MSYPNKQDNPAGAIPVYIAPNPGALAVNISTNTTTLVKSGAGILSSIAINTKGASSNTATVYDSLTGTGTILAVIDTTASIGTIQYNLKFSIGLTVVTATGTAANLTVMYS